MNQFFDTIGGLPLHPLTVHAASVLIPLSAIALVLLVFVPKWRKAYLPLTVGALAVSVGLAFAAKQSGEALAARVGNPADHQELGDLLLPASIGLFFLGLAFFFFTRKETKTPKWTLQVAGGLSTAAVAGVVVLSVLVGHSGAEATWGNRLAANQAEELVAPTDPNSGSTDGTSGGTSDGGITVAEVLKHNTKADCWSVVNGNVYDLTSYVSKHKGGEAVIQAICGKDGTKSFSGQHAGEAKPKTDLTSLLVGPLAAAGASSGSSAGATGTDSGLGTTVALTSAEVLKHNTGRDCWSVIKGEVYDLTPYVKDHPGGANLIKAICGKDGSTSFASEHAGAAKPKNILAAFALGPLVAGSTLPEATVRGEDEDEEGDDD